ncbi:MAG: Flp family type IVb pilin [Nevskia sp.]|nr:Flp family type IVb pilin [Nevskia sp.]
MIKKIQNFLRDDEGASAVEYGLIIGLIAVALVVIVGTIGGQVQGIFTTVSNALPAAAR